MNTPTIDAVSDLSALTAQAEDLLGTVDYLTKQLSLRGGLLDPAQIAMLTESAKTLRTVVRDINRRR